MPLERHFRMAPTTSGYLAQDERDLSESPRPWSWVGERMKVEIVPYQPDWPLRFERHAQRLRDALGPAARRIEHVGSTAVPGLAGKDVIDIQISVHSFEPEDRFRGPIESLGYLHFTDDDCRHRFFRLEDDNGNRLVNLHVCEAGSEWEERHLLFRDYLRTHPDAARDYEAHKRDLASIHQESLPYTEAKTSFIRAVERAAGWREA